MKQSGWVITYKKKGGRQINNVFYPSKKLAKLCSDTFSHLRDVKIIPATLEWEESKNGKA